MKCPFCFLEKDEQTFEYVKEYLSIIEKGNPTHEMDILIQRKEIEKHLESNHISCHDRQAITEWINCYSPNFRSFLNSIKIIALFLYFIKTSQPDTCAEKSAYELFCHAINLWNERKIQLVDSLFI